MYNLQLRNTLCLSLIALACILKGCGALVSKSGQEREIHYYINSVFEEEGAKGHYRLRLSYDLQPAPVVTELKGDMLIMFDKRARFAPKTEDALSGLSFPCKYVGSRLTGSFTLIFKCPAGAVIYPETDGETADIIFSG